MTTLTTDNKTINLMNDVLFKVFFRSKEAREREKFECHLTGYEEEIWKLKID